MKQKTITAVYLLILTVTLFTGCSNEPLQPQAVVINIRDISETTGINEKVKEHAEILKQQASDEIKALSEELSKKYEDEKVSLGENPSEEDKKKLQALGEQSRNQMIQARMERNARFTKDTSEHRQSYVDDIMSVAQVVAVEHGASIILTANVGVIWSDESVNITDEVIQRMAGSKDSDPAVEEQN